MWIGFVITMAASLALTPAARRLAIRFGAIDAPDGQRKLQKQPVPLWGGVAVYISLLVGLAVVNLGPLGDNPGLQTLSLVLASAAGIVCISGCIDDARDLNPRVKLLLQIISVLPAVVAGYCVDRIVLFGTPIALGWFGVPLTVFWLVGCINALNLLDGMDGLASAVGLSTAAMLAIIAMAMGHEHVSVVAIILAGALAGFLLYNLPPASIYLGDSGSMVIGLVVGLLSIQGSLKTTATLSMTAPAIVMSIPMLDTLLAILRRKLTGQRFDVPDRGHIHHRLLDRGLTTWQALCVISALCLLTGASATAATLLHSESLAWIFTLCLVVLLVRFRTVGHHEVALAKLKFASLLNSLVRRLVIGANPQPAQRKRLRSADLDSLWNHMVHDVNSLGGNRLEAHFGEQQAWMRQWDCPTRPAAASHVQTWSLSLAIESSEGAPCRITVWGTHPPQSQSSHLLQLVEVLQRYSQHWSKLQPQLAEASTTELPTRPAHASSGEETRASEQRRAA